MKKLIINFALILNGLMYSQNVVELPAKEAGLKTTQNPVGFFRGEDDVLYKTIKDEFKKENRYDLTIERYNEDLSLKFSVKISFPDDREYISDWKYTADKIFMFTNHYDGANKTLILRILDKETGKIISDKKQYGSLASDPFGKDARNFIIKTNPDKSKLMIISSFQWNKKPSVVNAIVYEFPSMKQIAEYKLPDTYNNALIRLYSYNLNGDGNLFYMFKEQVQEKGAPVKETIALYDFKTKNTKYKSLVPTTKTPESYNTFVHNDVLYEVGKYEEKISKKEKKVGTFCISYNLKDIDKVTANYESYPADVETKLAYKDGAGNRELSEKEITLTGHYKTSNGFYLVQNLTYKKETSGQNTTYIKYYSRDFIVTKFNFEGKREFVKMIPKYTAKDMYNADIMESGGDLYIFYCEHPKNLEKYTVENYDPANYDDVGDIRGPIPVCVKVGADGKLSRQTFEKNEDWCYYPGYGLRLSNGTQMLSVRVEKDKYISVVFKIKK